MDRPDAPANEGSNSTPGNIATEISPKSKQKKKSLCRILMNKKTRVGCLEVSYKDRGGEGDSNKNSKTELSHHGSHTSTKLSLCCAMTERSRTPPQSLTVSRLSPATLSCGSVKSELAYSASGNCQVEAFVEKARTSPNDDGYSTQKNEAYSAKESTRVPYADVSVSGDMSDSNKVTRNKSMLSKLAGLFKKKKKETASTESRPTSQGQTHGHAATKEQSSQGTSKISPQQGIYRKVVTSDATSSPETSSASSIDPAHVLVTVFNGEDKAANNATNRSQISNGINVERNGQISDKHTGANTNFNAKKSPNESWDNSIDEMKLVESFNKDVSISKLKVSNTDDKILIKQIDSSIKFNLNSGEAETTDTEVSFQDSKDGKISSEIMKRKWFNNEIFDDVTKNNHVTVTSEKIESVENSSHMKTQFIQAKKEEEAAATEGMILKEKHIKIEENKGEFRKDESQVFIEVERNEWDPEENYFTTGKYISYFLLAIERQYYDPTEVYSMVQYRDSEDSDDSDTEGENSSSESTSPHIPATMRRRLLHRRSADNLIVNSPTNSMRHSSPESVRSAPIQLKPRSTSHDALSKRKDKHGSQTDGISMDSLAKQSLLAAQVLNLIPAQKARERNFLHGRIAATSLLGPVELEKVLPNREIKIFIGTWNMNGQSPPKELNDFMLPSGIETIPDMLAIGTQESYSERSEWEAALQETLGPSHVLLTSTSLGTLHLALFVRRDLIWFCSIPEDSYFSTRPGTAFRTKGAIALAIMLFGTSFLFVTAHLTAHQDKVKERINDIKKIVRNLDLPKDLPTKNKNRDVTQNFDCVFWCGDLNFRLAQPREEIIQWITSTQFPQESPIDLHKDQLRMTLNEGAVLRGFEEGAITFPPTYKYDPGSQNFDSSSKQRTPAYTDRILFKGKGQTRGYIRSISNESTNSHKDGTIECLIYDSVPSICTSDHKPVWGVFKTTVRPGIDTIPLAAGLFNREVYLEGIKRRAAAMDDAGGLSRKNSRMSTS